MTTTYTTAPGGVTDLLDATLNRWHRDLVEAGVTFACLMAANENGDAVSLHGYAALAVIKANGLKDRVAGLADCTLVLDERAWEGMSEKEMSALLDHEMEHVDLVRDDGGRVKTDDAGRPKIRMRKHDINIGGFYSIIERHKTASHEWGALQQVQKALVQLNLPFGD